MPEAFRVPIGLRLNEVARMVARAFDDALAHAGGTLPVWLIMLNVKARRPTNQRELAEAVGVREATLTHHLNGMDARGLVTRVRKPGNRRVQVVRSPRRATRRSCGCARRRRPSTPGSRPGSPGPACATSTGSSAL